MTAWLIQTAARLAPGPVPLTEMRARFRRPLHPGAPAAVDGKVKSVDENHAVLDLAVAADGETLVAASVRVTR